MILVVVAGRLRYVGVLVVGTGATSGMAVLDWGVGVRMTRRAARRVVLRVSVHCRCLLEVARRGDVGSLVRPARNSQSRSYLGELKHRRLFSRSSIISGLDDGDDARKVGVQLSRRVTTRH